MSAFASNGSLVAFCLAVCAAPTTGQNVLRVPADFAHPQAALAAAVPGDVVLVADGSYAGPVDFLGKDVRLASENGAAAAFLDGGLATPCVLFQSGETRAAVLEGFTLRNGLSAVGTSGGGGIYCANSAPTVRGCVIKDCAAAEGTPATAWVGRHGGGALVQGGAPLFADCRFENNRAGGDSDLDPQHPTAPTAGFDGGDGGGLRATGCAHLRLLRCTFAGNRAGDGGDGAPAGYGGAGGGAAIVGSVATLEDCVFTGNFAGAGGTGDEIFGGGGGAGGGVGGLWLQGSGARLEHSVVASCAVRGNVGGGGEAGGATNAVFPGASPTFLDVEFSRNVGGGEAVGQFGVSFPGAGAFSGAATFRSCTIAANVAGFGVFGAAPGGLQVFGPTVATDCVVWGNVGGSFGVVSPGSAPLQVATSCVEGGFAGAGNLASDPLFAAPLADDFRLAAGSPCRDAGDPALTPSAPAVGTPAAADADGMPRFIDGDLNGVVRLDMGAYEFNHGRLAATKATAANGDTTVALSIDGTQGYFAFVAAGAPYDVWFPPYGPLRLAPDSLVELMVGPLPIPAATYVVPGGAPPFTVHLQALVFDGGLYGNFSNRLDLELP